MNDTDYKVLMIDDDELIARSTAEYFNILGLKTAYVTSYDAAVSFLEENSISLLLLDINLGDRSGFDLCKKIRESYDIPILFISARTSDDDVIIALNIGGDDYIKKPYTLSVLYAKVKAILGRYEKAKEAAQLAAQTNVQETAPPGGERIRLRDGVYLDTAMHKLVIDGRQEELRAMEYKLLLYLLEHAGRVVTKDELLQNVWGDAYTSDGTISVHIRHVREKIETDLKNPGIIKTVWGVGYVIEESALRSGDGA
ncbi:MAG: response regulator transcription factor [Oscillospiraceae bacterium]|nr:response regulator transcription factor [Oscillospiraceae bacterium]